ncbi:MAG: Ig-like domain-containing protein [Spirochaetia bacterium]|nr:Ig-like domain-containing protein [Spirochaetia bacterium]
MLAVLVGLLLLWTIECRQDQMDTLLLPGGGRAPKILATYPTNGLSGLRADEGLWVLFDMPMDRAKTESAFHVSSGTSSPEGVFGWDGQKMIFAPRAPLSGTEEFSMVIARGAESQAGLDLQEQTVVRFFAGTDTAAPTLTHSQPQDGATGIAPGTAVVLDFSEPIDMSTIASGITVSPSFLYTVTQNAARDQITLTPISPLSNGTLYTVRVSGELKDLSGNGLAPSQSFTFLVGTDTTPPRIMTVSAAGPQLIEGMLTSGIEKTSPIEIQFSEEMDRTTAENAVSLSPAVPAVHTWNASGDRLTLTFLPSLASQTVYSLTIADTALDKAGNSLRKTQSYQFLTDGTASKNPVVTGVFQENALPAGGCGSPAGTYGMPLIDFSPLDLTQEIDLDTPACKRGLILRVSFSHNMVRTSLVTSVSFSKVLGPGDFQIDDISVTGPDVSVRLFSAALPTAYSLWRLRINGGASGAKDTYGNFLAADYTLYVFF